MRNPNFAEGTSGVQQRYLYNGGSIEGPTGESYGNVQAPSDWIFFWLEGAPGVDPESLTGRPEAAPIFRPTSPDKERFLPDYPYSLKAFTFWRNHFMGVGQTVKAVPGNEYAWFIFAHAWYTQCSTRLHDPPYEKDCQTRLEWANMLIRLGVDPDGSQNPFEDDIVWGEWETIDYGKFGSVPFNSPFVEATSPYVTMWLQCRTTHSLKHCDLYLSHAEVETVLPLPSDCIYPAFPFKRFVNVYRPELGKERALEIMSEAWDKYGPQTFTPSYDEIPLGPSDPPRGLLSKFGRLWDIEPERHGDFKSYFAHYYPRKDYTIVFENELTPSPSPPPPQDGEILSLHIQTEVEGLRSFVHDMAARGNPLKWIKLVKGFESADWIAGHSPKTKVLAREINHPKLWEDPIKQARAILDAVWDSIAVNLIDALESTNEMFGTSNTKDEIDYLVSLEVAISHEIKRRSDILFDQTGRTVIGVLINAPVGNLQHGAQTALLQPVIDVALRNKHGISYHPYFPATSNPDLVRKWLIEEARHHHLRLQESWGEVLDGLFDCPIFLTEGGPIGCSVRSDNRPGQYFATQGWRHSNCLNGDFDFMVELLLVLRQMLLEGPGVVETYSIFTTGDPNIVGWDDFIVGKDEWPALLGALT